MGHLTIINGWIKEAIGIYYPGLSFGPFPAAPKWVVIHGTAWPNGSAQLIAQDWRNQGGDASTHILINKDGSFVQGISLDQTAWGNGGLTAGHASYLPAGLNPNMDTISIEHCKDAQDDSDEITPAQAATSFAVVAAICDYHKIPRVVWNCGDVSNGGIIRHADVDPVFRSHCPGPYPWPDLQNFLNGGPSMFSNPGCVSVWESNFKAAKLPIPERDRGIFDEWRAQWIAGHFKGAPTTDEYPYPLPDGTMSVAENFGSNTCVWNNGNPEWL